MSANLAPQYITEQEYRDGEEISLVKHEWFEGRVYAMAGGTYNHTTLCSNVSRLIGNALVGKPCKARNGEQRVKVEKNGLETYPDAVIFCPPARFTGTGNSTLFTPKVIFEVLSESTKNYDRIRKFESYQMIDTFTDYVLISQEVICVEHFRLIEEGWLFTSYSRLTDILVLENVQIEIPLTEIYAELELPELKNRQEIE